MESVNKKRKNERNSQGKKEKENVERRASKEVPNNRVYSV
jgi:hypothetical protein